MVKRIFNLTFLNEEDEEEVLEVEAYSVDQAVFLADNDNIVYVEESVAKAGM